jgi:hypothetical protein
MKYEAKAGVEMKITKIKATINRFIILLLFFFYPTGLILRIDSVNRVEKQPVLSELLLRLYKSVFRRFFSRFFCEVVCVFRPAKDDKFPPDEFADKVCQHGDSLDEVFIQSGIGGYLAEPGRDGNEENIEHADLEHGNGNIIGRLEGIAAIKREVIQNRQHDGNDMLPFVCYRRQKIEQRERTGFDQSGAQRQQSELDRLNQSLIWFFHLDSSLHAQRLDSQLYKYKYEYCQQIEQVFVLLDS